MKPNAIVVVATCRALKYNGGVPKTEVSQENLEALKKGIANLGVHIENMRKYNVPVVVAINRFGTDTDAELSFIEEYCKANGADFALSEVFGKGGDGGVELAQKVVEACDKPSDFAPIYPLELTVKEKIEAIASKIYGASKVNYTTAAEKAIAEVTKLEITVRNVSLSNGAGFVVAYTGDIMTMPGLPKKPAAHSIDVNAEGKITGLF